MDRTMKQEYRVLYIANPPEDWKVAEDTTPLMIAEARRRGAGTWCAIAGDLTAGREGMFVRCRTVDVGEGSGPLAMGPEETRNLNDFTVIHLRTDPPFDLDYYYTTLLLSQVEGPLVVNHPGWVRSLNEKLAILHFPQYITETLVTGSVREAAEFVRSVGGDAVAKNLASCSSKGIVRIQQRNGSLIRELEALRARWSGPLMLQRFLPAVEAGETRITLIDGRACGWMTKVPATGSFLASIDFGARVAPCRPTARDQALASEVGAWLRDRGIIFAALDVIDGKLSEINVTSPGLLRHTNAVMDRRLDIELEDAVQARRGGWKLSLPAR